MNIDVGILLAIIGGFVGLAGWQSSKDKSTKEDAEWKGQVNGKLDIIAGISTDVDKLTVKSEKLTERIVRLEASSEAIHRRLDDHIKEGDCPDAEN